LKKGAIVEGVMFRFPNETVVPSRMLIVGSIVMVKDPITGSTGAPGGKEGKSLALKLMVSVIVAAFAGLPAPVDASANAHANAPKVIFFMTRSLVVTPLQAFRRFSDAAVATRREERRKPLQDPAIPHPQSAPALS
jgi:hypothetical protein